ncbi:MAG: glycoside hydrolase family 32 protein [Chitinophagaceae bacterium]|nr:glycoside hydrolase family 32 protein [Chitinophagaceae bacterium]
MIRQKNKNWLLTGLLFAFIAPNSMAQPQKKEEGPYPSATPQFVFSEKLSEQEEQLKNNPLTLRFAKSRQKLASDKYRPLYHFVSPENMLNDPNGLCYWQGKWHLFYQAYPADEFPAAADIKKRRQHWGHAVSEDLVHWRDLPYAIYPGIEKMCFSGSTWVDKDRVIAFYPGIGAGQMTAVSKDPLLLNWDKSGPLNCDAGDADIWKEGETYYGLVGSREIYNEKSPGLPSSFFSSAYKYALWPQWKLWSSRDLKNWSSEGSLLSGNTPFTAKYDDGACPNFQPIGDKNIMLWFSHSNGGQYFLGDYDSVAHKFTPYDHGRFNHGRVAPGGVHAPSAAGDGKGGVINILNINDAKQSDDWDQIMSLPQQLSLNENKSLHIEPVASVTSLRTKHRYVGQTALPANKEIVLKTIQGNSMELNVEIDPEMSHWVQLNVLRSAHAEEQTSITFYNYDRKLTYWYDTQAEVVLDGSRSSTLNDVWVRPPERAVIDRGEKLLKLRVFIDKSVVEVFVNGRQYLAMRVYPGRDDSVGVSLLAEGRNATLKSLDAWEMKPIWPVKANSK